MASKRKRAGTSSAAGLDQATHTPATYTTTAQSRCAWCGRVLRSLPFELATVVLCSECYGAHHYEDRPGENPPDQPPTSEDSAGEDTPNALSTPS